MKLVPITPDAPGLDDIDIQTNDSTIPDVMQGVRRMYEVSGYQPPWTGYLAWMEGEWVGTCAFKSAPQGNRVEIAYFTFPDCEGRGIATKMAELLLAIADEAAPTLIVTAQTLPAANASTRILEKLRFQRTREFVHPQDGLVWEWERR